MDDFICPDYVKIDSKQNNIYRCVPAVFFFRWDDVHSEVMAALTYGQKGIVLQINACVHKEIWKFCVICNMEYMLSSLVPVSLSSAESVQHWPPV